MATATDKTPIGEGAAHALKRLEAAEAGAYKCFQGALATGDQIAIKSARDGWLKIGEQLRAYDLAIENNRREAGDLVERSVILSLAQGLATYLRLALNQTIQQCASTEALWTASLEDRLKAVDDAMAASRVNTIALLKCGWWGGGRLPGWLVSAAQEGLTSDLGPDPNEAERIEAFKFMLTLTPDQIKESL